MMLSSSDHPMPPKKTSSAKISKPKPTTKIAKPSPGRSAEGDFDVLNWPAQKTPHKLTRLRIGIHTSTNGGVAKAVERAYLLGCNTLQIFSSSPRMWRATTPSAEQCAEAKRLRAEHGIGPMVIHVNYLTNVCSANPE